MSQVTHIHEILPYTFNSVVTFPNGDVIQKQLIEGREYAYKTIYNGDVTIVIMDNGAKGVAKRSPKDPYSTQIGHDIAHARARVASANKEIERISKTQSVKERRIKVSK
ncbi:hypothetical protein LCM23_13170 [Cytobacillus kochii]|uniref:hypothetical protein n=1 Tax=Cytobacillus kochii TaxID=859143 RepID=UPI001CD400E7|nr:hypothetical protein [Cytobacillus kochii]MCA1027046.1 hypothetical protein [Cytobacillus kochii]